MKNKNLIIGLGVLAVAGIGYYMWKKKSETKSGACGCSGADGEDTNDYSNAQAGGTKTKFCCSKVDGNGNCVSWTEVNYMKPCSNPKKATFA